MRVSLRLIASAVFLAIVAFAAPSLAQVSGAILHLFPGDPGYPAGRFVQGPDGRLYGTVTQAGSLSAGAVFVIGVDSGGVTSSAVLHVFNGSDGRWPTSGLALANDGAFYGVTQAGGASDRGTVFRVTSDGTFTLLHSFTGADGAEPRASLIQASDGWLYGTTAQGGAGSVGTIFKMSLAGAFVSVHSFTGTSSPKNTGTGGYPYAPLVQASDGNLYGTTRDRLGNVAIVGQGTVYRLTLAGAVTTLTRFGMGPVVGYSAPAAGLAEGLDGALYGTAPPAIFKITTAGTATVLVNGISVANSLTRGTDGAFYGAGNNVFKLTTTALTNLHSFPSAPLPAGASVVMGGVMQASDGLFYGMTTYRGSADHGTIFRLAADGSAFQSLADFSSLDGEAPTGVIKASDGNFYGTTLRGGHANKGTLFRMTPAGGFSVLHSFSDGSDGGTPVARLVQTADGSIFGGTITGGLGWGTAFRLAPDGTFSTIRVFDDGAGPRRPGALTLTSDGTFVVNMRPAGLPSIIVFRMTTTGDVTTLGPAPPTTNAFTEAADGNLYAVVTGSVSETLIIDPFYTYDPGMVLRINPAGDGSVLKVFSCSKNPKSEPASCPDGSFPVGTLAPGPDNALYGVARSVLFRVGLDGVVSTVARLDSAGIDAPLTGLTRGSNGLFYGLATMTDGAEGIYSVSSAGAAQVVYRFSSSVGRNFNGPLVEDTPGTFYATAADGGPATYGIVYRMKLF